MGELADTGGGSPGTSSPKAASAATMRGSARGSSRSVQARVAQAARQPEAGGEISSSRHGALHSPEVVDGHRQQDLRVAGTRFVPPDAAGHPGV